MLKLVADYKEILGIQRGILKANDYGTFNENDVKIVFIKEYQSFDVDNYGHIHITINSHLRYIIRVNVKQIDSFIEKLLRIEKLDKIIDE